MNDEVLISEFNKRSLLSGIVFSLGLVGVATFWLLNPHYNFLSIRVSGTPVYVLAGGMLIVSAYVGCKFGYRLLSRDPAIRRVSGGVVMHVNPGTRIRVMKPFRVTPVTKTGWPPFQHKMFYVQTEGAVDPRPSRNRIPIFEQFLRSPIEKVRSALEEAGLQEDR